MYLAGLEKITGRAAGLALLVGTGLLAHQALADRPAADARAARATRDRLTPETFGRFHKLIQPEAGEYRWDEVTWLASIWHARKKAAAEDKPILIFGTQGAGFNDPLGNC